MKSAVRFTLAQQVLMNIIFVTLMVMGAYTMLSVPIERYPNVQFGQVSIQAFFPGASPADVEALVTREIEEALEDLDNVEFIRSTSNRNRSRILVKFVDDIDYRNAYDDLRLKVLSIMGELPDTVDPPVFELIESDIIYPVVSVNLSGDRENRALVLMAEEMKASLLQIFGVREVELDGEHVREYHVYLDPKKLNRFGVTFDEAVTAMRNANIAIPAGDLDTPDGEYVLLVDEQYRTRDQVAATVVRRDADGSFVTVGDLMERAEMSHRDPVVISSVNGKNCVTLKVKKTGDGNALDMLEEIEALIADYRPVLEREGVEVVLTQDSTIKIRDAMTTLGWNLALGIILVCFLIWYFMGFRNAALTTIGIPFAFLMTVIFMYFTNNSINEITLFSFILVSGIVVDDAIVVIENIYRHLQMGKTVNDSIVDGTSEVFLPVVSATLTTIAAFMPMLIMTGSVGEFFAQIPKAVSFALAASVLECLFILPIHYKDYGPRPVGAKADLPDEEKEAASMPLLRKPVRRLMDLALRWRWTSLLLLALVLFVAVGVMAVSITGKFPLIRVKFFPDDYGAFFVELEAPVGTSLEDVDTLLKEVSVEIMKHGPGMAESTVGYAGFILDEDYEVNFANNVGHVVVTIPPSSKAKFADYPENDPLLHLDWVREQMKPFEDRGYFVRVRPQKDGPPTGKDINVRTVGTNQDAVYALADRMKDFLTTDPRLKDELVNLEDTRGQDNKIYRFQVRHDRAAEYGVSPAQVTQLTAATLNGRYIGEFRDQDEQVDLKVKMSRIETPDQALGIPLLEYAGGPVRLGDLNRTRLDNEAGFLNRFEGERAVNISANLRPGSNQSPVTVVRMVKEFYNQVRNEYPGATLNFAGEFEDTRRSYASLFSAFIISVLLIYMILATQFQSYIQPLIVLSAVAFAFIGVIFGLLASRSLLTINNMVAMVGVVGVVVNDSLVLIEFINKLYRSGVPRREAVLRGMQIRLRPILLTTLTTTLAFLPMALGIPSYSIVWGSMASTFVTGLCTATALTLFMIPVQWDLLTQFNERYGQKKRKEILGP
ncbi:MAG: efflux RND transporter permease subunit [Acidobacteriota bacterium]|nr:efflux RND transporter permease subunit [Acidobacteriota bacterium]